MRAFNAVVQFRAISLLGWLEVANHGQTKKLLEM
jgi:hypothetical protein